MRLQNFIVFCVLNLSMIDVVHGQLPIHRIPYVHQDVEVDGKLDDWREAWAVTFEDTLSSLRMTPGWSLYEFFGRSFDYSKIKGPRSKNRVRVRAFWNYERLNIAFEVFDQHLFGEMAYDADAPRIHMNDGVEIYLDTKDDSESRMDINDYQFLIDVHNNTVVLRGDRRLMPVDTLAAPKDFGQNVFFESVVSVYGQVNDEMEDSMYVVEVSIPFAAIGMQPSSGMILKLDLCNNDMDYSFAQATSYVDSASVIWPYNWVGLSNFSFPQYWQRIALLGEPSWLQGLSMKYSRSWLKFYGVTFLVTILVLTFLLIRIRKLRRLPTRDEISPAQAMILRGGPEEPEALSANQRLLQKATTFILENKHRNLHSEDVAEHLCISLRTFQRVTREELQCTPTNFLYLVKLNFAAEFLRTRQGNVTDAAYELGFSYPSYFTKLFKKHFGVSPLKYQKEQATKI